jgi:hypothetical protein
MLPECLTYKNLEVLMKKFAFLFFTFFTVYNSYAEGGWLGDKVRTSSIQTWVTSTTPPTVYAGDWFEGEIWLWYQNDPGLGAQFVYTTNNWANTSYDVFSRGNVSDNNARYSNEGSSIGSWSAGTVVQYKIQCWHAWQNPDFFTNESTFTVSALNNPSTQVATRNSSNPATSVDLSWAKDAESHNVMIVRKLSTDSWTEPTQNTQYSASASIGAGVVVYNGPLTSYINTGLSTGLIYDYKFYSENNQYYSSGVLAQVTTGSAATDYFQSVVGSGNWSSTGSWQSSSNHGSTWVSATLAPSLSAESVTISGTHTITVNATETAKDLTVIAGGTLIINPNSSLTVTGTLTNPANNAAGLVIKSTASGTGSLIHNSDNVPATVERYINGNSTLTSMIYHQVSIPLTSASSPTSNLFLGSYLFDFLENGGSSGTWNSLGNSTSSSLNVDKGYLIYYPGTSVTYSFAGNLRNGSVTPVTPAISYTDGTHGYNLIPNPFPSAIDWDAVSGWSLNHVDDAIYVWNSGASIANYGSYVGSTTTNGVTNFIPVGQAFFVRTNAASPSISMNNNVRVHNSKAFMKTGTVSNPYELHFFAQADSIKDELAIRFASDVTENFDSHADAYKFYGYPETPQVNSVTPDGTRLSINSLPFTTGDAIVPLDFSLNAATDVTFTATGMESFYEGIPIYLEDHLLNKVVDLRTDPVYTFSHTAGSAGNRFLIRFMGVTGTPEHTTTDGSAFVSNGHLYVDVPAMSRSEATISIYDMLGRQFSSRKIMLSGITELPAPAASGVYVVKILAGNKSFERKIVVNL